MPWTLRYPDSIDGRVTRNHHRQMFGATTEVESLEVRQFPVPSLIVNWRNEQTTTDSPELQAIYRQYGYEEVEVPIQAVGHGFDRTVNMNGDVVTPEVRQQIIAEYLANPGARERFTQAMIAPIRRNLDYQSTARRTFMVEELPEGALPVYDRDPEPGAMRTVTTTPHVRPDWLKEGQWVEHAGRKVYARIEQVTKLRVVAAMWKTMEMHSENVVSFSANWKPVAEPQEPRVAWKRLLDEDDF